MNIEIQQNYKSYESLMEQYHFRFARMGFENMKMHNNIFIDLLKLPFGLECSTLQNVQNYRKSNIVCYTMFKLHKTGASLKYTFPLFRKKSNAKLSILILINNF